MEHLNDIKDFLSELLVAKKKVNLQARSVAWSGMRKNGKISEDAPEALGKEIETDLAEYGFSLLRVSLTYKERGGDTVLFRRGFETAGKVFENLTINAADDLIENDFYRIISACCYHIAGFSAMAYSVVNYPNVNNLTPVEIALRFLILRNIKELKTFLETFLTDNLNSDEGLGNKFEEEEIDIDEMVSSVLNISGCKALAHFEFALQTGNIGLFEQSKEVLRKAINLAINSNNVPHYWILRLILNLIDDLWASSLHTNLPITFLSPQENDYEQLRELFLAVLYSRNNAEVELWPSQLEAARRAIDLSDDLVVALPTSAGKTRIAELTSLMTLAARKRILIVTPLRALSAQTERSFRATFAPLGFKVSSLYGASGSGGDEDALRTNDIIISTPEKIDFALRTDPSIINDIGLVILDEGHLIGANEREIRFEILVQKLLKRTDAHGRRIVCLSAILPSGQPLNDFTLWVRNDKEGDPISVPWRPTRQRFGTITFLRDSAKLNYGEQDHQGFIRRFIEFKPTDGDIKLRSGDLRDITMTSAWKFAQSGKRVLVFVTQANWVEGFGKTAIELIDQGFLPSLSPDPRSIRRALQIGEEWLGADHPAVLSLKIGVGIHHGKLPSQFLRELEILLTEGKLLITVASPTLSQGLNINAAVLLVPYLTRSGEQITGEEFANVAGRAGRAFVDVEGLVFHIIKDDQDNRRRKWFRLVKSARSRNLQSGILQVINAILTNLSNSGILNQPDAFEYLANSIDAWKNPVNQQNTNHREAKLSFEIENNLEMLDAMVFGLIESLDSEVSDLPELLEIALTSSLWERQLASKDNKLKEIHRKILQARASLIWEHTTPYTRKGHYAMGVGLEAGLRIDELAQELSESLDNADVAALNGNLKELIKNVIELANLILKISPFKPEDPLPDNWKDLIQVWLSGFSVDDIGPRNMPFIESVFVYKLVWALESLRIKRISSGWKPEDHSGMAAACIETGTYCYQVALLIRAGLPSRIAATKAVSITNATFLNTSELHEWLLSDEILMLTNTVKWPTSATSDIWKKFRNDFLKRDQRKLRRDRIVDKYLQEPPEKDLGVLYRLVSNHEGQCMVKTPDFQEVGLLFQKIISGNVGQAHVELRKSGHAIIHQIGPDRLKWD